MKMTKTSRLQSFWSFLTIFLTIFHLCSSQREEELAPRATIAGNVTLGGLFPLHFPGKTGPCSVFNSLRAIQEVEAFLFSVDQVNANKSLLPNITLGVKAFDTCGDATTALNSAVKEFVLGSKWYSPDEECVKHEQPVAGMIGPGYSYEAVHITPFLNLFEIPLISYSATSPALSDKTKYSYFSRTASSDVFQIPAIINLLLHFNWTYVSILYTDESYGMEGHEHLETIARDKGIYFANKLKMVPQKYDKVKYKEIVKDILSTETANVIILFGVESAMEPLLYMIQENAGNRSLQFVGSDALASAINEELNKVQRITHQAFFFNLPTRRVDGFTKYFLNLSVQENKRNPWFKGFFETFMNCTFENTRKDAKPKTIKPQCDPTQTLANANFSIHVKDFTQSVPLVVDAVYAFAHALDHFLEGCQKNLNKSCVPLHKIPGNRLLGVLREQVFRSPSGSVVNFTQNGDVMGVYDIFYHGKCGGKTYQYFKVGQWNGQKLHFENRDWRKEFIPLQSTCETFCSANQFRKKRSKRPRQCWKCFDCKSGSYAVNETFCQVCPKGQKPDLYHRMCIEIIPAYLTVDGQVVPLFLVVLPIIFSSFGLAMVIFVFIVFVKYWNTPLVKASGRELSSLLLLGILLAFLFPFVAISRPSPAKCFWQFVLGSLPFTICFVAIAVKNNRTYRIFNPNRVVTAQPSMIRPKSQILVSFGLVAFQLILVAALVSLDFPRDKMVYSTSTINYACIISDIQMYLSHVYNVLLLIACTYYGYKTKNIPRNFNETKHIAFAMYGACVSMLAFGIVYFFNSTFSNDYGVVVQMMNNNLVGFIIILCFFAPKIYIILLKPEENVHNLTVKSNSVMATEHDTTAREHRRSRNQPLNGIELEEFNIKKVEPASTNEMDIK